MVLRPIRRTIRRIVSRTHHTSSSCHSSTVEQYEQIPFLFLLPPFLSLLPLAGQPSAGPSGRPGRLPAYGPQEPFGPHGPHDGQAGRQAGRHHAYVVLRAACLTHSPFGATKKIPPMPLRGKFSAFFLRKKYPLCGIFGEFYYKLSSFLSIFIGKS